MKKTISALSVAMFVLTMTPAVFAANDREPVRAQVGQNTVVESTGEYIKNRVRTLENETEEGEKTRIREEVVARVKNKAELAIQAAVNRYNKVKNQVQNSNLTDEEKAAVGATIDAQVQALNTLKNEVQVAKSVEEVKNVMTKLKTRFKYSLGLVRQSIKGVYEDRLSNIAEKIQIPYEKILKQVELLSDSDEKDNLLTELSTANSLIVSAQSKIESGELDLAKADLISARAILVSAVTSLKN